MLIQAVEQAIPLYTMNCFKHPSDFLHELSMMLTSFWWGDVGLKKDALKTMGLVVLFKNGWKAWVQRLRGLQLGTNSKTMVEASTK